MIFKHLSAIMLSLAMIVSLAACGNSTETNGASSTLPDSTPATQSENTSAAESASETEPDVTSTEEDEEGNASSEPEAGSNILVAYFPLAGEQYQVGVIEEGNTSIIAHMIAEQTGADLYEIEPTTPYPETYDGLLEISQQEMADDARPEIANPVENMDAYDTVFIGYPIWWGDMPMIVYNFLESYDLSGKTIIPFCTHGGSGLAGTEGTIAEITGATMIDGLSISGETAQNDREAAQQQVTEWLQEAGYLA